MKSELGKGSDFVVTFVAKPAPIEALTPDGKVLSGKSGNLSGTLLLAEDNDINAIIAERIFSSFNVKSVRAHDGLEAVELFKASRPGDYFAILMDIQMPKLNGYEATEAIRALDRPDAKRVPIIAMTADAFSLAQEKSYRSGMNDYVTKPLDPTALEQALLRIKK